MPLWTACSSVHVKTVSSACSRSPCTATSTTLWEPAVTQKQLHTPHLQNPCTKNVLTQFDRAISSEKDVTAFHISVDHKIQVKKIQSLQALREKTETGGCHNIHFSEANAIWCELLSFSDEDWEKWVFLFAITFKFCHQYLCFYRQGMQCRQVRSKHLERQGGEQQTNVRDRARF